MREYPAWYRDLEQAPLKAFLRSAQEPNRGHTGIWLNFRLSSVLTWVEHPEKKIEVFVHAKRGADGEKIANVIYSLGYLLFENYGAQELFAWIAKKNRPAIRLGISCGLWPQEEVKTIEGHDLVRLSMSRGIYEDYHAHLKGNWEEHKKTGVLH